nr:hypothetical protein WS3_00021 [Pantoea sp.]
MCNKKNLNGKSLHTEELPSNNEGLYKTDNKDEIKAGIDNSIGEGCNQSCKCCAVNNEEKKEKNEDPLDGYYIVWIIFALLAFGSFVIPMWKDDKEISWWLTFIGLGTLFISLCAYFYDNFISKKEPCNLVRVLKVLGDLGAAVIVFGTFKLLAVNWDSSEKIFASAFTVVILFLTAYKAKKDI